MVPQSVIGFIWKRVVLIFPTLLVVSAIVFLIFHLLPGNVIGVTIGDFPSSSTIKKQMERDLGLDDPLFSQYLSWIWSLVNGEFGGYSLHTKESLRSIFARQIPVTFLLTSYSLILSILLGIPLGIFGALTKNHWFKLGFRLISVFGLAVPQILFCIGVLLACLYIFDWSPPIMYSSLVDSAWPHFQIMIFPTLILSFELSCNIARVTRSSMLEVLTNDYILTARSKGLKDSTVWLNHGLPNVIPSVITFLGLQIGLLFTGVVVVETVFGLPGMGRGIVQAALARDYPVVQSMVVFLVFISILVNLIAESICMLFSPSIRERLLGK